MRSSTYTPLLQKLLSLEDLIWYEHSARSFSRHIPGFDGTLHSFYCLFDGITLKITRIRNLPNARFNHQTSKFPQEEILRFELSIDDQKRRFGRRKCEAVAFQPDDTDLTLLKQLFEAISQKESTQKERSAQRVSEATFIRSVTQLLS